MFKLVEYDFLINITKYVKICKVKLCYLSELKYSTTITKNMQMQEFPNPNSDNIIILSIQFVTFLFFFCGFDCMNLNGEKNKMFN